ncbi:hypothetical protein CEE45_02460 [Candidatus Heimdallarchaeota archaeon B3_Heim]|nr:MAG: hypothetical protein CEE45_02460 [Candidatus Heimdallarchaeota archaeon B3_Heim]
MTLDLNSIQGIPKDILPDKVDSIQIIKGGMNNQNILLNGSYLLKAYIQRDEKNDPVQLRYLREKTAFVKLTNLKFMPNFLNSYEKENELYIARMWAEGRILSLTDLDNYTDTLVTTLSSLHRQHYTCEADYNYFDVITRYLQEYRHRFRNQKWNLPDVMAVSSFYDQNKDKLVELEKSRLLTRIHGDLVFSNIICSHQKCIFIDWEYTTYGDPLIDLAYLITQNSIAKKSERKLIRLYAHHNFLEIDPRRLSIYKNLMNLMSALWYSLQVMRFSNNKLTHSELNLSGTQFEELAKQGFSQLKIH